MAISALGPYTHFLPPLNEFLRFSTASPKDGERTTFQRKTPVFIRIVALIDPIILPLKPFPVIPLSLSKCPIFTQNLSPDAASACPSLKPARPGNPERNRTLAWGKWRAAVLITIHLIIAARIVQWQLTGSAVSPVEPSESMQTLEVGIINAGFVFFLAAILLTLVFGRFICGWACHIVALQDFCGWIMKKCGIRPTPFRSRLLVFVPLGLALYMFVWPTFKRVALVPALDRIAPAVVDFIGRPAPFPVDGFRTEFIVEDFWATFPGVFVAIPSC